MSLLCGANEMQRTGGSLIHMAALKYIPNSPLVGAVKIYAQNCLQAPAE